MKKPNLTETFFYSNLKFLITNQTQFAKECDLSRRTLQDIIYGSTPNPGILKIIKIASALNVSIDDLIYKDLTKENN